jgi:adenosylcobinamide amidohydrolase
VIAVTLARPWLIAGLPRPMRVLGWAPHRPGFVMASRIVWREVRNADLPAGLDVDRWFAAELATAGQTEAVAMLTSRDVATFRQHRVTVDGVPADCVATLGLSNAESVGTRRPYHTADFGTINLAVALGAALTEAAQIEALSIAVQARTAAVIDAGLDLPTGRATGTGTDCLALACDAGDLPHAGMHTAVGEAVGAAVRVAVSDAATDWMAWRAAQGPR